MPCGTTMKRHMAHGGRVEDYTDECPECENAAKKEFSTALEERESEPEMVTGVN